MAPQNFYKSLTESARRFAPAFAPIADKLGSDLSSLSDLPALNDAYKNIMHPVYGDAFSTSAPQQGASTFHPSYGDEGYSRFEPAKPSYAGQDWAGWLSRLTSMTGQQQQTSMGGPSVPVGNSGYAALDAHNTEVGVSAGANGVPANLIKSVINRESSGDWERDGSRIACPDGNDCLIPFLGIRKSTAESVGLDWNQMLGNKQMQIEAAARVLARDHQAYGSWEAALSNYLTGDPNAWQTGGTDSKGMSASYYVTEAMNLWHQMDASGGAGTSYQQQYGQGGQAPSGTTSFSSIWGGTQAPITFEFNAGGGPDLYGYGTQYGMNGSGHTGVDVGVPMGTLLRAPMAGTITCAGTGIGSGSDGGGCAAFNDVMGQGNGRIELQLDNGQVIILGHTSTSTVHPGQRVNAGDPLGTSGGMNGAHVHVEGRVRDPSTGSGWRIVDPRQILGGNFTGSFGSSPTTGSAPATNPNMVQLRYDPFRRKESFYGRSLFG